MDAQFLLQAVTSVGFPIVCCGAMMWYVKYTIDGNREDVDKLNQMHRDEMLGITEAINNNTMALQKLCDKLESGKGE